MIRSSAQKLTEHIYCRHLCQRVALSYPWLPETDQSVCIPVACCGEQAMQGYTVSTVFLGVLDWYGDPSWICVEQR